MSETTKTHKVEETKIEKQSVDIRPLTNVAITGSTPSRSLSRSWLSQRQWVWEELSSFQVGVFKEGVG